MTIPRPTRVTMSPAIINPLPECPHRMAITSRVLRSRPSRWGRERVRLASVRAPARPAQPLDRSPRTHGAQPVAVLRLALPDRSPLTHGAQPVAVLRLALPDRSPRPHGAQPAAVLRLALPGRSPRTHGAQPVAVLRLALRPGGGPLGPATPWSIRHSR